MRDVFRLLLPSACELGPSHLWFRSFPHNAHHVPTKWTFILLFVMSVRGLVSIPSQTFFVWRSVVRCWVVFFCRVVCGWMEEVIKYGQIIKMPRLWLCPYGSQNSRVSCYSHPHPTSCRENPQIILPLLACEAVLALWSVWGGWMPTEVLYHATIHTSCYTHQT